MAKKKTTEAPEDLNLENEAPEVAEQPEANAEEAETKNESEPSTDEATEEVEIPAKALAYLKRHPEDKEVYIDRFGGVFPANTPKVFVKDAVLYQNPYFK